jgi:hypothetical protein
MIDFASRSISSPHERRWAKRERALSRRRPAHAEAISDWNIERGMFPETVGKYQHFFSNKLDLPKQLSTGVYVSSL